MVVDLQNRREIGAASVDQVERAIGHAPFQRVAKTDVSASQIKKRRITRIFDLSCFLAFLNGLDRHRAGFAHIRRGLAFFIEIQDPVAGIEPGSQPDAFLHRKGQSGANDLPVIGRVHRPDAGTQILHGPAKIISKKLLLRSHVFIKRRFGDPASFADVHDGYPVVALFKEHRQSGLDNQIFFVFLFVNLTSSGSEQRMAMSPL